MKAFLCALLVSATAFGTEAEKVACVSVVRSPPTLRSEGLTELIGDITLNCTGGTPTPIGMPVPRTDIIVQLNTTVTSRVLNSSGWSEAILMVDEPGANVTPAVPQLVCQPPGDCPILGTGNGAGVYSGVVGRPNVFYGNLSSANTVVFKSVPIDPPEANSQRIIRIANVRANALQLGYSGTPQQITAMVWFSNRNFLVDSAPITLANVQPAVSLGVPKSGSFEQCGNFNNGLLFTDVNGTPGPAVASLQITERWFGALKAKGGQEPSVPGSAYNSEAGFILEPGSGALPGTGLADFGARILMRFNNIGTGVRIILPSTIGSPGPLFTASSPTGTISGGTLTVTPDLGRGAFLYFEKQIVDSTPGSPPVTLNVPLTFSGTPSFLPGPTNFLVNMGFAPTLDPPNIFVPGSPFQTTFPATDLLSSGAQPGGDSAFDLATLSPCTNAPGTLQSDPQNINFSGAISPAAQTKARPAASPPAPSTTLITPRVWNVGIYSSAQAVSNITYTKDPAATWLNVGLSGTTSPATLFFSVNSAAAGTYSTAVKVSAPGGGSVSVPVSYTVAPAPWFTRFGFAHNASYVSDVVAPGEPFVIFGGDEFGPSTLAGPTIGASGLVATTLGNTQVLFDGTPVPLYYSVDANGIGQVAGFAPFELATKTQTSVKVLYNGVSSPAVLLNVLDAVPGLYTADSSGGGQGAILNQDLSVNGATNPAAVGSVVVLYGGGAGQTSPGGRNGAFAGVGGPLAQFNLPVKVFIDGIAATNIPYAGPAPGLVEGVFQINVTIPPGVRPGAHVPVMVQVEDKQSQPGVTLATK